MVYTKRWGYEVNEAEARKVIDNLKVPGSIILVDDVRTADQYIAECKGFIAGLESERKRAGKLVEALEKLQIFCELHLGKCQDYSYTALAEYEHSTGNEEGK